MITMKTRTPSAYGKISANRIKSQPTITKILEIICFSKTFVELQIQNDWPLVDKSQQITEFFSKIQQIKNPKTVKPSWSVTKSTISTTANKNTNLIDRGIMTNKEKLKIQRSKKQYQMNKTSPALENKLGRKTESQDLDQG